MLVVKSVPVELRGVANKVTKAGNSFLVLNCETADGTPYPLYCPKADALPQGLKKGDMVCVSFDVRVYNGSERLVVTKVERAN